MSANSEPAAGPETAKIAAVFDRAMASAAPAMRSVVEYVGQNGEEALNDKTIETICRHVHPLLPFPIRLVVNQRRLSVFIGGNRNLVVAAARRASIAN